MKSKASIWLVVLIGLVLWAAASLSPAGAAEAASTSPQMNSPQGISAVVEQMKNTPAAMTPEQKAAYLPLFYDTIKQGDAIGGDIRAKAAEGAKIIWKDTAISDRALENTLARYFSRNPGNFTESLKNHFWDFVNSDDKRPARFDRIACKTLIDHITKPLFLASDDNLLGSNLIKNKAINAAVKNAAAFTGMMLNPEEYRGYGGEFISGTSKLTDKDREYLLASLLDMIRRVPYLTNWKRAEGYAGAGKDEDEKVGLESNYRIQALEQTAVLVTKVFDLNPHTNPGLSDKKRTEIKARIKNAFHLDGLYAKTWDDFTILISPGIRPMNENVKRHYYNAFKAYPSVPLLLAYSRLLYAGGYRRFDGKFDPTNSFNTAFLISPGILEPSLHGLGHNIIHYLNSNKRLPRLEELSKRVNFKFGQFLSGLAWDAARCAPEEWPKGWSRDWRSGNASPLEMLAGTTDNYMQNSQKLFALALSQFDKGYKEPINQFLYILDIFTLKTNTGRFYYLSDDLRSYDPSKITNDFTITKVPVIRDEKGRIIAIRVGGKSYRFYLDDDGYVLRYTTLILN